MKRRDVIKGGLGLVASAVAPSAFGETCPPTMGGTNPVNCPLPPPPTGGSIASLAGSMSPGSWQQLTTTSGLNSITANYLNGSYGSQQGNRGFFEYATRGIWLPNRAELHFRGSGHQSVGIHIKYSEATGEWTYLSSHSGWEHQYDHTAYDSQNDVLYAKKPAGRAIYRWQVSSGAGQWSTAQSLPQNPEIATGLAWFPETNGGAGGLVHHDSPDRGPLQISNPNVSSWRNVSTSAINSRSAYHTNAVYLPAQGVVLFGGGDNSGNRAGILYPDDSTESRNNLPAFWGASDNGYMGTVIADEVTGRIFFVSATTDKIYEHNFNADSWTAIADTPNLNLRSFVTMISSYGCIMLVEGDSTDTSPNIWLYKI